MVKVQWSETRHFEAEIEIDGFEVNEATPDTLTEAIGELSSEAHDDAEFDGSEIEIEGHEVVREGDAPIAVPAPRKQYEDMF